MGRIHHIHTYMNLPFRPHVWFIITIYTYISWGICLSVNEAQPSLFTFLVLWMKTNEVCIVFIYICICLPFGLSHHRPTHPSTYHIVCVCGVFAATCIPNYKLKHKLHLSMCVRDAWTLYMQTINIRHKDVMECEGDRGWWVVEFGFGYVHLYINVYFINSIVCVCENYDKQMCVAIILCIYELRFNVADQRYAAATQYLCCTAHK